MKPGKIQTSDAMCSEPSQLQSSVHSEADTTDGTGDMLISMHIMKPGHLSGEKFHGFVQSFYIYTYLNLCFELLSRNKY